MRRTAFLLVIILLLGMFRAVSADLFLDQEAPDDWAGRDDIMRLTAFPTLVNDCTLLEVGGKSMLIDGGAGKWHLQLWDTLSELGYQHVNVIFNTHPHDDHLEGVIRLLPDGLTADEFWSQYEKTNENRLLQQAVFGLDQAGVSYHQLSQCETVDFGGATLVFYWWEKGNNLNARSVQMHITFGKSTVLMAADVEGSAEEKLLDLYPPELFKADILKYPHHGYSWANPGYMDAVSPVFAFVTNRKSEIPDAVRQLENRGIAARYTTAGRLVMVTDGTDWYIIQYKGEF